MLYKSLIFGLFIFSAFQVEAIARENICQLHAKKFLVDLLAKNEKNLVKYEEGSGFFFNGKKLNSDIVDFLYEPREKGQKSVTEIAEMGEILIKVVKQPDDSFIVIYYPQKYKLEIDNSINFLEKQWMKKYFACEFRMVSESIKLHHSFCFAETGGPFSDTY